MLRRSKNPKQKNSMTFTDHLEDLRWHIIRSVLAILIVGIVIFICRDAIFDYFILGPLHPDFASYKWMCALGKILGQEEYLCIREGISMKLQSTEISGIFNMSIQFSFIGGIVGAFPYLAWEIWQFVKPALKEKEVKNSQLLIFWISFFFFIGILFGYYVIAPFSINFLFNFNLGSSGIIEVKPTINDYIENFTTTMLGVAIAFELPIVIYILSKMSIVSVRMLRSIRRYMFVIILFIAAIITPSPDWISQMIVAIPLLLLYEISILVASRVEKNKEMKKNEIWE